MSSEVSNQNDVINRNISAILALCAGISPVNSPNKGQWCGALMFSLICTCSNGWVNTRDASDLRRHRAHSDVTVVIKMTLWRGNAILAISLLHFFLWGKFTGRHWALCAGNSLVAAEFLSQRPVTRSFGVFFYVRLNKWLSKQSRYQWYGSPLCSFWRHCNMAIGQKRGTVVISRINTAGSSTHDHNTWRALSSNSAARIASVDFQCTFGCYFEIIFIHLMIWFKMTNEITSAMAASWIL